MPLFTGPQSFRQTVEHSSIANGLSIPYPDASTSLILFPDGGAQQGGQGGLPHLILLVFSAVLEVVCVSAPGYIVARMGMFNAEAQKFVANLNVMLFTPCLIFTKLASQLSAGKMADLAIIPIIFVVQTFVSYLSSAVISRCFGFKKRQTNFVTAMGVFGNSNSLPISLVISLSKTLSGLHWDRIPNDNDDEVAARGILYLMIFQQLGQLLRWSWGYRVLLAPREYYFRDEEERVNAKIDHGHEAYSDHPHSDDATAVGSSTGHETPPRLSIDSSDSFLSSSHTPVHHQSLVQQPQLQSSSEDHSPLLAPPDQSYGTFMVRRNTTGNLFRFPELEPRHEPLEPHGLKGWMRTRKECARDCLSRGKKHFSAQMGKVFSFLPRPIQRAVRWGGGFFQRFIRGMWEFMNPPLWAMLIAVFVASIPSLQDMFFERGTFINNSITQAIESNAGVAVPLILVVLGANLERSTLPKEAFHDYEDPNEEKKLVIASLLARMLVPTLIMGPLLALTAKFVPVSILDDPIFIIVCFLLAGAPSALQLAQICQINNVYMGAMSNLLFQSYVIWILPSTLILVVCALKVVEWATM